MRRRKTPPGSWIGSQIGPRSPIGAPLLTQSLEIGATESNTTILLIDSSNLAWADLTHARGEILRFLQALPASESVGLYVVKANGLQVLEEGTADHAMLAAKLSQWMPSAKELARAQEEETRNRQHFDEVLHPEDSGNT